MGSPDSECEHFVDVPGYPTCSEYTFGEKPFHEVWLPPFRIDQVEIRAWQYKACMDAGVCTVPSDKLGSSQQPVNYDLPLGTGGVAGTIALDPGLPPPGADTLRITVSATFPPQFPEKELQVTDPVFPLAFEILDLTPGEYYVLATMDNPPQNSGTEPGMEDYVGIHPAPGMPAKIQIIDGQVTQSVDFYLFTFDVFKQSALLNTLDKLDEGDFPINGANWNQLKIYCEWAGKRLCTEAEWARAAKGDAHRLWPWGDEWHEGWGNSHEPAALDGFDWVAPVGSYPQAESPYGVLDMDGNLMEFVLDWYQFGYFAESPFVNPQGPCDGESPCPGSGGKRILRGSSWRIEASSGLGAAFDSRTSSRIPYQASGGLYDDVGSRCCLDGVVD